MRKRKPRWTRPTSSPLLVYDAERREGDDALHADLLGDLPLERAHEDALARLVVAALDMAADAQAELAVQPRLASGAEAARGEDLAAARDGDVGDYLAVARVELHVRAGQEFMLSLDKRGYLLAAARYEAVPALYPGREGGGLDN